MMSLATIEKLSKVQAIHAAALRSTPYVFHRVAEVDDCPPFPFPNIGDYEPPGWEEVDRLFCDKSGMGAEDEPAPTIGRFMETLKVVIRAAEAQDETVGFAIVEEGQCQLYVGVFRKTSA